MNDEQLDDLTAEYLLARERGDGGALERLLAAHPEHEDRLLAFALLDVAVPTYSDAQELRAAASAITPALKQRALAAAFPVIEPISGLIARGESLGLAGRNLAAAVGLPQDVLLQLDRRLVSVQSVPHRCLQRLAETLRTSAEAVQAFLAGGPPQRVAAFNYAAAPVRTGAQGSFAEALAESALATPGQRAYWEEILRDEGLA